MGKVTITINVDEELVRKLREMRAQEKVGKGFLGKAIGEAIVSYLEEKKKEGTKKRFLERLRKGYNLGGLTYKKR